jgi:hypothetical protein
MADKKISDLTELTTPAAEDLLAIVDNSGTPVTKNITYTNLVPTGTTANKIVQLDGDAKLPAVDGSQLTGISTGATTALDNLASVAINTSLISDTDDTDDLGSDAKKWKDGYFAGDLKVLGDIYTAAWTDYSATSTITGWSEFTTKQIYTKKIGKTVFVQFHLAGTSDSATTSFTIPYTSTQDIGGGTADVLDNNTWFDGSTVIILASSGTLVRITKGGSSAGWTDSGTKRVRGSIWLPIA